MPEICSIISGASEDLRGRIIGIPPPTLASNKKLTFFCFAI